MQRALPLLLAAGMLAAAAEEEYIRLGPAPKGQAPAMRVKQLSKSPRSFEVVLGKGDEVVSGMTEFAEKNNLKAGTITAVAAFKQAVLGMADPGGKGYKKIATINEEVEVVITGIFTLNNNGTPRFHAHAICVYPDGHTVGGHLLEGHVGITMDTMVTELQTEPDAKFDK